MEISGAGRAPDLRMRCELKVPVWKAIKVAELNKATEITLARIIEILKTTGEPTSGGKRLFFPDGIDYIDLKVKVGTVEVNVTVSGTKR
jgi:hypothetical protein